MASNYVINFDPKVVWGAIVSMSGAAVVGAWKLGRIIIKNRRARQMVAAALDFKEGEKDNDFGDPQLSRAIFEILRRIENDRVEDRKERTRQWERIEEMIALTRENTQATYAIVNSINNLGNYMDQTHKYQSKQIEDVDTNIVRLSDYLRDRLGRSWGEFQGRPTAG